MLSLYQVIGRAWSGKEGGGGVNSRCAFFASVFTIFAHFHLGTWNRPLNDIHRRLGGRRGGGVVLCTIALQADPLCRTTPLIAAPPSNFQMCVRYVIFVSLLSSLVCKANLACHFELVSIQWRPLNLFVVVFVVAACVWLWIYKQASSYVYRYQHQLRSEF